MRVLVNTPVLLTASLEDDFANELSLDFSDIYEAMRLKIPNSKLHLFGVGKHPAMISNAKEFADTARGFLLEKRAT